MTKASSAETRNYVTGIEYLGANLDAIYHAEGRCTPNGATAFHYEYTLKDHLGNQNVPSPLALILPQQAPFSFPSRPASSPLHPSKT